MRPPGHGETPRLLLLASLACTVLGAGAALGGIGRHAGWNVSAALLTLAAAGLSRRAWTLARRRALPAMQRAHLVAALRVTPSLSIRIAAVASDPEALAYARQLRDALREADWPIQGVYRDGTSLGTAGVFVAVQDPDAVPDEARFLVAALRRVGVAAEPSTKPALRDARTVELLVGHRP